MKHVFVVVAACALLTGSAAAEQNSSRADPTDFGDRRLGDRNGIDRTSRSEASREPLSFDAWRGNRQEAGDRSIGGGNRLGRPEGGGLGLSRQFDRANTPGCLNALDRHEGCLKQQEQLGKSLATVAPRMGLAALGASKVAGKYGGASPMMVQVAAVGGAASALLTSTPTLGIEAYDTHQACRGPHPVTVCRILGEPPQVGPAGIGLPKW